MADAGSVQVGIKNSDPIAPVGKAGSNVGRDGTFADTAFTAHKSDFVFNFIETKSEFFP
jgi:hypothetical protein